MDIETCLYIFAIYNLTVPTYRNLYGGEQFGIQIANHLIHPSKII